MVTVGLEQEILRHLADMPFLDRIELASIAGAWSSQVYEVIDYLEGHGLLAGVQHGLPNLRSTRRMYPTEAGIRSLARAEGTGADQLLERSPVSQQWQRLLLERLDSVAVIYRLVADMAEVIDPIDFRWYRAAPMDAGITLPNGGFIAIIRQGETADRTSFSKRLWRLWQTVEPSAVFVTVPDNIRLRYNRSRFTAAPVITFTALESSLTIEDRDYPIWWAPSSNLPISTRSALQNIREHPVTPPTESPVEPIPPIVSLEPSPGQPSPVYLLNTLLNPTEKRALDVIYDWPWISQSSLGAMLGLLPSNLSPIVRGLTDQCLVEHTVVSRRRRMALTDRALHLLARRDRTSLSKMVGRWSIAPRDLKQPQDWRNISGSRSRQLLRDIGHTSEVQGFIGGTAIQAPQLGWEIAQLDPPRKASRYFHYDGKLHSVQPDAFGVLQKNRTSWCFFLEWERRAVHPATMAKRLAPYLRYFSTRRPIEDNGTVPAVLVVFEDELAAGHFLRIARQEMDQYRVEVPLWVSHKASLLRRGLFGKAWQTADSLQMVSPLSEG